MSESLRDQFDPQAPITDHQRLLIEGVQAMEQRMITPNRGFHVAYVMLAGGGAYRSVYLQGDAGTGKTTYGDLLMGEENRTNIKKKDTAADLFGAQHPIDPDTYTEASLVGLRNGNPVAYLNELPHLSDTGDIHHIWDSKKITISGQDHDISNIAILGTGNFPDGQRNTAFDSAMLSRWGAILITGDHSSETMKNIHENALTMSQKNDRSPILPPASVRAKLGEYMDTQFIPESGEYGKYIVNLIRNLDESGLASGPSGMLSDNDVRISHGLRNAATADMFMREENVVQIKPYHLARVAALALPSVVTLSRQAKELLQDNAGDRRLSNLEQAIALRRVIAMSAFRTIHQLAASDKLPRETEAKLNKFMADYSYANKAAITGYDVDEALFSKKAA